MSERNVEIVRRYIEGWNEAPEPPAWVAGFWESDGNYYPARAFPEATPCHGREEIADFLVGLREPWNYRVAIKAAWAIGDDRVLVHTHVRAEGGTSGATAEGEVYSCFWLPHGRFIRVEDHLTAKGALHALGLSGETLEAAGLSEQAMSQENVEILRLAYEAYLGSQDVLQYLDPNVELYPGIEAPDQHMKYVGWISPCGMAERHRDIRHRIQRRSPRLREENRSMETGFGSPLAWRQ